MIWKKKSIIWRDKYFTQQYDTQIYPSLLAIYNIHYIKKLLKKPKVTSMNVELKNYLKVKFYSYWLEKTIKLQLYKEIAGFSDRNYFKS